MSQIECELPAAAEAQRELRGSLKTAESAAHSGGELAGMGASHPEAETAAATGFAPEKQSELRRSAEAGGELAGMGASHPEAETAVPLAAPHAQHRDIVGLAGAEGESSAGADKGATSAAKCASPFSAALSKDSTRVHGRLLLLDFLARAIGSRPRCKPRRRLLVHTRSLAVIGGSISQTNENIALPRRIKNPWCGTNVAVHTLKKGKFEITHSFSWLLAQNKNAANSGPEGTEVSCAKCRQTKHSLLVHRCTRAGFWVDFGCQRPVFNQLPQQ